MENKEYPKINKDKLMNRAGHCPNCKESNLDYGAVQFESNLCYFPYKCNNCGLEGEEWHLLEFAGHNIYDEDGNVIEVEEN